MKEVAVATARVQLKRDILKMRKQDGFSLIELLIVVAIILIIAAIAIPNLLRARISANDAAAASTIRTINTAEVTYSTAYAATGFGASLAVLGPVATTCTAPTAAAACLIDNVVGCATGSTTGCTKGGYNYFLTSTVAVPVPDYTASASPLGVGSTGSHNYCSTTNVVVRMNVGTLAVAGKLAAPETATNCVDVTKYAALQ
jgi:type IV pilus assembly protein PilA